ncbi:MAG: alpha/beta hydrolase [Alphaproteobacteria bacterium]|nr:alpha/beta hydrolase [Alphaproteobacteria bacterium]MBV9542086.1 alpha/beta hydrolase [Alphaproteobacteria bacterium]MBV9903247.1 alpha/beta hydrolase [Alphaproteobacteria bacterium]
MATFESSGLTLAYDDIPGSGEGRPMILVHGFTSNRNENWRRLGWYGALERRRMRTIALDMRGHGESAKPHDPAAYGRENMTNDIFALMDHLNVPRAHILGFSMGSRMALNAALKAPDRVATLTLGGVGEKLFERREVVGNPMAEAMEEPDIEKIKDPMLKSFRQFADDQGEDRLALAALTRAGDQPFTKTDVEKLPVPVLVVAGARDELAGDPEPLAKAFPDGRAVRVPGVDHFSIIGHALFKASVFDFLDGAI